ncbi:hypothetical protein PspLS_02139 [Pyricularia sp. CBS 133598]|nr:hypothetical protein PspLS_02139 [Pyricularia sp. CBS 133598]
MSIRNTWNRMLRRTSTGSTTSSSSSNSDSSITPASTAPSSPGWGPSATFSWLVPSISKTSSGGGASSPPTSTPAVATQPLPHSKSDKEKKKSKKSYYSSSSSAAGHKKKRVHPSERPLTKENLRHQELFANFSFGEPGSGNSCHRDFGSRHSFESGVSPCSSRRNSFAYA